jgi:hypothetical protein
MHGVLGMVAWELIVAGLPRGQNDLIWPSFIMGVISYSIFNVQQRGISGV